MAHVWIRSGAIALSLAAGSAAAGGQTPPLEGISFAEVPGALYLPLREVGEVLEMPVRWDAGTRTAHLGDRAVAPESMEALADGTRLLSLRDLKDWGMGVRWDAERQTVTLLQEGRQIEVRTGPKRVEVDRGSQQMKAWQGDRLVLASRVSTGRRGHATPLGTFKAGPYKARMHRSRLYNDAPMPWSVQVNGNVFIHGFGSVPAFAASHGCIRVPLSGSNPARWFYRWIDVGTPVTIVAGVSPPAT